MHMLISELSQCTTTDHEIKSCQQYVVHKVEYIVPGYCHFMVQTEDWPKYFSRKYYIIEAQMLWQSNPLLFYSNVSCFLSSLLDGFKQLICWQCWSNEYSLIFQQDLDTFHTLTFQLLKNFFDGWRTTSAGHRHFELMNLSCHCVDSFAKLLQMNTTVLYTIS